MAYVTKMIANGETLIGVSRLHWIYLVQGLVWLIGLMAVGFMLDALIGMALGAIIPGTQFYFAGLQATWLELFFLAAGLYLFGIFFVKVATTEFALTDQRVIYKVGWIFVNVQEMNLDEIRGTRVDLGMLGRFLGYGSIALDARFVGDLVTGHINKPYRFTKAMNEAQENIDANISLVIDHAKGGKFNVRQPSEKEKASTANPPPPPPETTPQTPQKWEDRKMQVENQPVLSKEQIARALQGEVITLPGKSQPKQKAKGQAPTPQPGEESFDPADRPQAQAHPVAEGSYEEERLKEDLIDEWEEISEPAEQEEDDHRSSRRYH